VPNRGCARESNRAELQGLGLGPRAYRRARGQQRCAPAPTPSKHARERPPGAAVYAEGPRAPARARRKRAVWRTRRGVAQVPNAALVAKSLPFADRVVASRADARLGDGAGAGAAPAPAPAPVAEVQVSKVEGMAQAGLPTGPRCAASTAQAERACAHRRPPLDERGRLRRGARGTGAIHRGGIRREPEGPRPHQGPCDPAPAPCVGRPRCPERRRIGLFQHRPIGLFERRRVSPRAMPGAAPHGRRTAGGSAGVPQRDRVQLRACAALRPRGPRERRPPRGTGCSLRTRGPGARQPPPRPAPRTPRARAGGRRGTCSAACEIVAGPPRGGRSTSIGSKRSSHTGPSSTSAYRRAPCPAPLRRRTPRVTAAS